MYGKTGALLHTPEWTEFTVLKVYKSEKKNETVLPPKKKSIHKRNLEHEQILCRNSIDPLKACQVLFYSICKQKYFNWSMILFISVVSPR